MDDLIARIEQAKGPDRELDLAISTALNLGRSLDPGRLGPAYYTASIDAALRLVPEGWMVVHLSELGGAGGCVCKLGNPGTGQDVMADAGERTMALAICAAALRARQAGEAP